VVSSGPGIGKRIMTDEVQNQNDKGDGILPGGQGRTTIFVDTSTVSVPLRSLLAIQTPPSFLRPPNTLLCISLRSVLTYRSTRQPPVNSNVKPHQNPTEFSSPVPSLVYLGLRNLQISSWPSRETTLRRNTLLMHLSRRLGRKSWI
jgi:hypothetical protein